MKLKQMALAGAMLGAGAFGIATSAHALNLTPFAAPDNSTTWASTDLNNLQQTVLQGIVGVSPLALAYKQDQGGFESGDADAYYTTTFAYESMGDATGATITWDGGMFISCGNCFLIVKDGNHDANNPPPWPQYIYDISGWDGQETITLSGFWPGPGAISNVAIWNDAYEGGGATLVPEADTYAMLLAGLGLVGFAARRKLRKQV